MRLEIWDPRRMAAALRSGDPVDLRTTRCGDGVPAEIAPLCHAVPEAWAAWLPPPARPSGRTAARVTVVVPSNRGAPLGALGWLAQDEPVDLRVLWNGAGGAPAVPGATVSRVPWLGHGRTRQAALDGVTTPYVLFSVDDAVPLGAGFVRTLVEALEGSDADAVWARQVPWPDASRRTRDRLRAWCPPSGVVPPTRLDHVCALHRTSLLRADPLDDVPIAEDWAWGRRHRCALVPGAPVLHSHAPALRGSFARTRAIHGVMRRAGPEPARVGAAALLRALPGALPDRDALGELLGQYAAYTFGS